MKNIATYDLLKPDPLSEILLSLDFRVLSYVDWTEQENRIINNEILPHFKLVAVERGSIELMIKDQRLLIEKGDLAIIPPYTLFTAACLTEEKAHLYIFHFDLKTDLVRNSFAKLFSCHQLTVYSKLFTEQDLFWFSTFSHQNADKPGYYFNLEVLLKKALAAILMNANAYYAANADRAANNTSEERIFVECLDYITEHVHDNIKVKDLCTHLNVSQSYLYQCFHQIKGCSTKEFILMFRMKQICNDLRNTTMSLAEISELYNFSSPIAFSASFKNQYGKSPAAYRKQYKTELKTKKK